MQKPKIANPPTIPRLDRHQWLTGFFATSDFPGLAGVADPPEMATAGCHGGIVTKILSKGSHAWNGGSTVEVEGWLVVESAGAVVVLLEDDGKFGS